MHTITSITTHNGIEYINEYTDADSFDHLPKEACSQCYAFAFLKDNPAKGFIIVNNIKKPGSYTPVGGSVESGEHPDQALIREVKEESNMKVLKYLSIGYQKTTPQIEGGIPFYQLRYVCIVEPYGPFISDPAGKVTEIIFVSPETYTTYFNWGEVSDRLVKRAVERLRELT